MRSPKEAAAVATQGPSMSWAVRIMYPTVYPGASGAGRGVSKSLAPGLPDRDKVSHRWHVIFAPSSSSATSRTASGKLATQRCHMRPPGPSGAMSRTGALRQASSGAPKAPCLAARLRDALRQSGHRRFPTIIAPVTADPNCLPATAGRARRRDHTDGSTAASRVGNTIGGVSGKVAG